MTSKIILRRASVSEPNFMAIYAIVFKTFHAKQKNISLMVAHSEKCRGQFVSSSGDYECLPRTASHSIQQLYVFKSSQEVLS